MKTGSIVNIKVKKIKAGQGFAEEDDNLAVEEPLEIQLLYGPNDNRIRKNISVTMRTPGNDEELAAGFLFTEGIIHNRKQVLDVKAVPLTENKVLVTLKENEIPLLKNTERNFYTTSSCGVCGKSGIDAIKTVSVYENNNDNESLFFIKEDLLYLLPNKLREQQAIFESTGGLHASALFDFEGSFEMQREDVGRHNALDKLIGNAFLNEQLPLDKKILLLSGRASFELIQKAAMAGMRIVTAVGAPSSLAVELAKESGITLIGFLNDKRFNIYSGDEKIKF